MGMFDKYDTLSPDYIPDNSTPESYTKHLVVDTIRPKPMYNIKGNLVGYTWNNGELFDFTLSVNSKIKVKNDSLLYSQDGAKPDGLTVGTYEGQKAYNTVNAKSWTFVGRANGLYMWVEDKEIIYPIDGDREIVINADMTDSYILFTIYDFKWETKYTQQSEIGESSMTIKVDEELSTTLSSGLYYCTVKICSENSAILKDKFTISIM